MKESVLILGAAALQVPLINYVKAKGYRLLVVSIPGDYPGFALADRCIYCDIRDGDKILAEIEGENVISVLTDETDMSVPTVAYIANKLGLVGNTLETAVIYANKFMMREICQEIGISVPKFYRASSIEEIENKETLLNYPVIMKPEDNQGSRGIYYINSLNEAISNFSDSVGYSRTGYVIVEEFFRGKEVVVEGFVFNGVYVNWGIAERKYFAMDKIFIPSQTIFPAVISEKISNLLIEAEIRLHSELKPSFGMIHSEYLINETTGEYILVETALRGGGVYISSHLVPYYTGYNNYDLLFDCSLGKVANVDSIRESIIPSSSGYVCFYLPEGEIISVSGFVQIKNMPCVKVADIDNLVIGTRIEKMTNKTQRLGPIVLKAENRDMLEKYIEEIQSVLKIEVRTLDGSIQGIHWN